MTPREELCAILRDRQRIVGSPEAQAMRGALPEICVPALLEKWRAILAAEALNNPLSGDTL